MSESIEHDLETLGPPSTDAESSLSTDSTTAETVSEATTDPVTTDSLKAADGVETLEDRWARPLESLDERWKRPVDDARGGHDDGDEDEHDVLDEVRPAGGFSERTLELESCALREHDPLIACMGVLIAQQMRSVDQLYAPFTEVVASTPRDLASFERLSKPLMAIQALHRQIERFAHIRLRLAESLAKSKRQEPLRGFKLDEPPLQLRRRRPH